MQAYTELIPPTGVTHAIALPFTSATAQNLVIAKTSLLQIFSLKTLDDGTTTNLVLVSEHQIAGTITALSRVKTLTSRGGGEAVLIAVRDAKLSLIEWDAELYSISTISIHYYESEDLQQNPWAPKINQCPTRLTVDPSSRCAAFNFGVQNLAILPFHQIGDDLVMDEYDSDQETKNDEKGANGDISAYSTPYASSFVLPLTALDPGLLHPIDLAFLHEYREPTFGILYTSISRSQALAHERKDVTLYAVFTLDLEQKASTTLLSISRLPNDLYKVVPLAPPVGGALLVGSNELVHVDQGGKTNAIGVNEFARECSSFAMTDQSSLNLRLEGCQIVSLGPSSNDLLVILASGLLALLKFRLDGRTVSGITLSLVDQDGTPSVLTAAASCATIVGPASVFIGSEETDSVLVGWIKTWNHLTRRQNSKAGLRGSSAVVANGDDQQTDGEEEEEDDEDLDEDLYGTAETEQIQRTRSIDIGPNLSMKFTVLDRLLNVGPIRDYTFGIPAQSARNVGSEPDNNIAELELVVASGSGKAGGVTVLKRELDPHITSTTILNGATGIWSLRVKSIASDEDELLDQYLIVSSLKSSGVEESDLYELTPDGMKSMRETEFEPSAGGTIAAGSIANGTRIVQALPGELRCYDSVFGLSQIYPIVDEDTGAQAKVMSLSIADPYILVVREDSTILLLQADKSGDLDECELPDSLQEAIWLSGCLYRDTSSMFEGGVTLFLLDGAGSLHVYSTAALAASLFVNKGLHFLPSRLTQDPLPKHWRQPATLTELLVADLGDSNSKTTYLILRTGTDDVVLYQPYVPSADDSSPDQRPPVAFVKVPNRLVPKSPVESAEEAADADTMRHNKPLTLFSDENGRSLVFMPGASPTLLTKTASGLPQGYRIRAKAIKALTAYNTTDCPNGFAWINGTGDLHTAQFDSNVLLGELPWIVAKKPLGVNVRNISFFERTGTYVLATGHTEDFQLPQDDEWHPEWKEEQESLAPQVERGALKLLSSKTWNIISSHDFDVDERVMCLKTLNLAISDESHERKDLIVVGTALTKGEDVSARGSIYIFDVVDVVPEPGVEETDLRLKLIAKDDVKGAVTALSQVGSQGFLMAAQGQKCMVRGLKEDQTIWSVAFLDMNYYVNVIKELKGTGLCILGDGCHGLWFTGYSEEPYKLQVFGRDIANVDTMAADFLPSGKQLFIVAADGDCDLHVFQYDPENPKSRQGTELLHRSTFHLGYLPTNISLIPRTPVSSEVVAASSVGDMDIDLDFAEQQVLVTTQEGAIALLTPLSEQAYRRLSTLQNLLVTNLEHPCGLNPRAYRSAETDGIGGRAVIDGNLLMRWLDQSSQNKASLADKIGATVWEIRGDLEGISGAGMGYV